jgi:hypothetical protein
MASCTCVTLFVSLLVNFWRRFHVSETGFIPARSSHQGAQYNYALPRKGEGILADGIKTALFERAAHDLHLFCPLQPCLDLHECFDLQAL